VCHRGNFDHNFNAYKPNFIISNHVPCPASHLSYTVSIPLSIRIVTDFLQVCHHGSSGTKEGRCTHDARSCRIVGCCGRGDARSQHSRSRCVGACGNRCDQTDTTSAAAATLRRGAGAGNRAYECGVLRPNSGAEAGGNTADVARERLGDAGDGGVNGAGSGTDTPGDGGYIAGATARGGGGNDR
jgi:hypothetical protein